MATTAKANESGIGQPVARVGQRRRHWCILRMAGPRTLAVAKSLADVGMDVWTPTQIIKKRLKATRGEKSAGQRVVGEVAAAILPTFVFARSDHLPTLFSISNDPASQHPDFSVFHYAGRVPLIGDADILGLRHQEAAAAASRQEERECETRAEAERQRIARLRTERERLKAMRSVRRDFARGDHVTIDAAPALGGLSGIIESSDGTSAVVAFGGALTMKIEAWRLIPNSVCAIAIAA